MSKIVCLSRVRGFLDYLMKKYLENDIESLLLVQKLLYFFIVCKNSLAAK